MATSLTIGSEESHVELCSRVARAALETLESTWLITNGLSQTAYEELRKHLKSCPSVFPRTPPVALTASPQDRGTMTDTEL